MEDSSGTETETSLGICIKLCATQVKTQAFQILSNDARQQSSVHENHYT